MTETTRRALVAGSSGGIGAACVELLARRGWQVVGIDRDTGVDITDPGGAEQAVADAARQLGGLDAIVHAIGMSGRGLGDGPVTRCSDQAWAEVLRVNLESVFRLLRSGLPSLAQEGGGAFAVVGSVLGVSADADFLTAAYAVSKGGLIPLMRVAALEGAPLGVRVNLVVAGLVDTPMARRALSSNRIGGRINELQPLGGRALTSSEVAAAVAWVVSSDSTGVTGASIPVDRGWLLR